MGRGGRRRHTWHTVRGKETCGPVRKQKAGGKTDSGGPPSTAVARTRRTCHTRPRERPLAQGSRVRLAARSVGCNDRVVWRIWRQPSSRQMHSQSLGLKVRYCRRETAFGRNISSVNTRPIRRHAALEAHTTALDLHHKMILRPRSKGQTRWSRDYSNPQRKEQNS